jgi:cytochrome P450
MCPWAIHRDSRFWPDPLRFDPERFAGEGLQRASRFDYFPFAGAPRVGVGQRFAIMEAQTVIARVLQTFKLEPLSAAVVPPQTSP